MTPQQSALHIQRYATEAIEGLRTQGATADTEHRLNDIRALAHDIVNDLQTNPSESIELLKPKEVDLLFRYPLGRTLRLAKAKRITHIELPDGEIRFDKKTIDSLLKENSSLTNS